MREDDKLETLYKSISKGARVLNLTAAFRQTGLNELKQPRLAIARADWPDVLCRRWSMPGPGFGIEFIDHNGWHSRVRDIRVPLGVPVGELFNDRLSSPVPHIPPTCRPKFGLHNYHILFEVKEWKAYPVDPFLLRRISGMLFVVEAEWDLTPLEAELLASMRGGN